MVASSYRLVATIILIAFAAIVSVTGMLEWWQNRPPTIGEAFPTGTMVVAVDATFPPFAFDNGESVYGIDIDIGNELAESMGIEVRFVTMGFDGLYDALIDGQVDVVISALLLNPSRTREVRYTIPYFDNGLLLVSRNSSISVADLPSTSLSLEYGSIAHSQANTWLERIDPFVIHPYELPQYALDSVRLGESDHALVDTTSYLLYSSQYPEMANSVQRVTNAPYAIAIRHDREDTWEWVNAVLSNMKNDGTLDTIINNQFGINDE